MVQNQMISSRRGAIALAATLSFLALPVSAVTMTGAHAQTVADIATYSGPDREQKLIEGAKKEGTLNLYSSATVKDQKALTDAFEQKYGIKVVSWRSSGEGLLQRSVAEAHANRFTVDAFETDGPIMESLDREKLLQPLESPVFASLIPEAIRPNKDWIGDRVQVFTAAYNTNAISDSEVPKSYQDLLDPKYKGKLGIEAADLDWFSAVVSSMGEEKGLKLFRDIVAKNGISVRKGHTLLANLVVSGEVPISLTAYLYKVEQLEKDGAPIKGFVIPPEIGRFQGTGIAKQAPHPYAATLFVDWLLSDGQKIFAKRHILPTNIKIQPLPANMKLTYIDPAKILDENDKWEKLYKEIFLDQAH